MVPMEMPDPEACRVALERIVGDWEGPETLHPAPYNPMGGAAVGRSRNRLALDGFVVIEEYEHRPRGQVSYRRHSVTSYDSSEKRYVRHQWDSMGNSANAFHGRFEGDVLTMTYEEPGLSARQVMDYSDPERLTILMEVSRQGAPFEAIMEAEYLRKG
jgi:hypothetical protein